MALGDITVTEVDEGHLIGVGQVGAMFSNRIGGVSGGSFESLNVSIRTEDEPANVSKNLAILGARAGFASDQIVSMQQVHGGRVVSTAEGEGLEADALVSADSGKAALVVTADCLPVLIAGNESFALVHAGWRGIAAAVLENAFARLMHEGDQPFAAVLGACAGPCCYEVGDEVFSALGASPTTDRLIDLPAIATARLRSMGIQQIESLGCCTICDPLERYFSHRAQGPSTGRQGTLAWLNR